MCRRGATQDVGAGLQRPRRRGAGASVLLVVELLAGDGGFVHQATDREIGHHEPVEFLANEVRRFAAQQHLAAMQVGLEFVEGRLNLPALVIEGGQFFGWSRLWVQDGRDDPIGRFLDWRGQS